jgi:hypothetical protein
MFSGLIPVPKSRICILDPTIVTETGTVCFAVIWLSQAFVITSVNTEVSTLEYISLPNIEKAFVVDDIDDIMIE